ncbi:hypothetical protein C7M84_007849 [Penaeus vannamei]|uniref:Uncharacterized protein n=1 Tax=Penaeus vannamei TaxID=6689 RepID=A0A423TB39_PENVA|nr:hypothetical protein C7M84_007849 [Penaeus vannamei]
MAQASASRLALTVKLEMYIDEFFNSPFFTNYSSSYLLMTLKDITSLLPNLPVKRLNVDRSGSRRRNFVDDFSADGKTAPRREETDKHYNVFICPNRSKNPGRVYRGLVRNEFAGDGYFERSAGYSVPPWIQLSVEGKRCKQAGGAVVEAPHIHAQTDTAAGCLCPRSRVCSLSRTLRRTSFRVF